MARRRRGIFHTPKISNAWLYGLVLIVGAVVFLDVRHGGAIGKSGTPPPAVPPPPPPIPRLDIPFTVPGRAATGPPTTRPRAPGPGQTRPGPTPTPHETTRNRTNIPIPGIGYGYARPFDDAY